MATLAELQDALVNADKAGDVDAARQLADAIHGMRAGPAPVEQPKLPLSRMERFGKGLRDPVDGGAQLLTKMLPDAVVNAGNRFNNFLADTTGLVGRLPEGGVDQQVREAEKDYQERQGGGIDGYRIAGNILSPVNVAALSRIPQAATLGGRVLAGAAGGAASGALSPISSDNYAADKAKQVGTSAAFGGAVGPIVGGVARVISPNASKNAELQLLKSEGVRPTMGQTLGGGWNAAEERLTSLPLVGDAIAAARRRSMEQFNKAAINRTTAPVGGKVEGIGQEGVREAGDVLSRAYDDALAQVKAVRFDKQFAREFKQLDGMAQSLTPQMRDKFNATVKNILGGRTSGNGSMLGPTFKKVDSEIGGMASKFGGSSVASEQELGDALKQLQALLRAQMVRTNPKAAQAIRAADEGWANLVRVEGAAKAGKNADGLFTPAQLNAAIQAADKSTRKRAVARGEALMQDLAGAGQNVLGNKVPDSGTAQRLMFGGGAVGGGYLVDPMIPLGLLGAAGLYTRPAQGLLNWAIASRPGFAEPVADALRKASPALIPASAQLGLGLLQ